jgi:integrative and conjugative element protein (TIGR02256 family)
MNYENIIKYFLSASFEVEPFEIDGRDCIMVNVEISNQQITLIHFCEKEMTSLPHFFFKNHEKHGVLAHVLPDSLTKMGTICVNDLDSVSVNFERPELAFEESITRHIDLLQKVISNPGWNREELLREFKVNWAQIPSLIDGGLVCASQTGNLDKLTISRPITKYFSSKTYIGISEGNSDLNACSFLKEGSHREYKNIRSYVIPLDALEPAPQFKEGLGNWYLNAITKIKSNCFPEFEANYAQLRSKEFWIIFNAPTPSGVTWFGVILRSKKKTIIPRNKKDLSIWSVERLVVEVFNKELIMPRSGANPSLDSKKVLLLGCGSVGSELALKLGSAGVGNIHLCDPDVFTNSNIYRHSLNKHFVGAFKSEAMAFDLSTRFPWITATASKEKLLELRTNNLQYSFDLMIVAIGSPTHERLFHEYLVKNKINIPVINTWLEGYGIGGHATLDIPKSKGCLRCAYVHNDTGVRGLASNLNFFESNQVVVNNYAGCGETFIPYGAVSSAQTALIASDLAIQYLENRIIESKKVSWKGDPSGAIQQGLTVTSRYNYFNESLVKTSLYNPRCDICCDESDSRYEGAGITINISKDVLESWMNYRQIDRCSIESAGLLVGYRGIESNILIDGITNPKDSDINKHTFFKLDDKKHRLEIEKIHAESQQNRAYIGTWHTHPQEYPTPSSLDYHDWHKHVEENTDRQLFFVVIGTKSIKIFTIENEHFIELQKVI